jgi:hypothetical protein
MNCNWYKESQSSVKKPYYVVRIIRGREEIISQLRHERVYAVSASQARYFFLQKYPWLNDNFELFSDVAEIEARLDKDKMEEDQNEKERLVRVERQRKEDREKAIQEQWWHK